jgi:hypothetical protein
MDAQLHKVNLVGGEHPVRGPQHPRTQIKMPAGHIVSCRRGAGEPDRTHQLRCRAQLAALFHQDGLRSESQTRHATEDQQLAIAAMP